MSRYYCVDCGEEQPEGVTCCPKCGRTLYTPEPLEDAKKPKVDPKIYKLCIVLSMIGFAILVVSVFIPFYRVEWNGEVKYISLFDQGHMAMIVGAMIGSAFACALLPGTKGFSFEGIWLMMFCWGALFFANGKFNMTDGVFKVGPWYGVLVYSIGIIFIIVASEIYKKAAKRNEKQ